MLTIISAVALGIYGLFRVRDRTGALGLLWKFMDKGADLQERAVRTRWLLPVLASLAAAFLLTGYAYRTRTEIFIRAGLIIGIPAFFMGWDWAFTWSERQLGQLVRSPETRRYSFAVLAITFVLFLAVPFFPAGSVWVRIADGMSLAAVFCGGLWAAVQSIRHSIFETFPSEDEELGRFAMTVLRTIIHHFATAALLAWGSLGYLNKLFPGSFINPEGDPAGFWLLGNYAVGKLTVAGSSLVTPSTGLGGLIDTMFSVLGAGFMVLAVTCLFSVLSRAKTERNPPQP